MKSLHSSCERPLITDASLTLEIPPHVVVSTSETGKSTSSHVLYASDVKLPFKHSNPLRKWECNGLEQRVRCGQNLNKYIEGHQLLIEPFSTNAQL